MNSGIFIIGTPIHNYTKIINDAFHTNGIESTFRTYSYPNPILKSIPLLSSLYSRIFLRLSGKRFYTLIKNSKNEFRILLLFGMNNIPKEQLKNLKNIKKIKVAIWFIDSMYAYKNLNDVIDIADYIFCYNKSDAEDLISRGKNAMFLPLAFDSNSYFQFETEKKYDLFFVGALRSRIDFLEKLFVHLKPAQLKIRIDGKLSYMFRIRNCYRYPNFLRYHRNINPDHKSINASYNSSRICLNIQPEQAQTAFSIRTFEICGAGGFQLTNGNRELLDTLFQTGRDLEYYSELEDLVEKINYFLNPLNDQELNRIASNGYSIAKERHSFKTRIREIIEFLDPERLE